MTAPLPPLPAAAASALLGLYGLSRLLACVEPARWNSLGRPGAQALAALTGLLLAGLADGLSEIAELPEDVEAA